MPAMTCKSKSWCH